MKIKIDNYEIYKDDCLVVMEGIPCESVGLIVTRCKLSISKFLLSPSRR